MRFDFREYGIEVSGQGEVKALCPQCSASRKKAKQKCLNVNTETGVWHCWHCEWSGKAREPKAMTITHDKPKAYAKPVLRGSGLSLAAQDWLTSRGITPAVAARNGVTTEKVWMPQVEGEVLAIAYPYRRSGEVVNVKYRDREKNFRMASGAERILYGYDDIGPTTVIVEGEMDKLAVEVAGIVSCVSVPDGAPAANTKNLQTKFDFLGDDKVLGVERWIIAVDADAPGQRLQDELIRRFGAEKCAVVKWPDGCKDANDVLLTYGPEVLRKHLDAAEPVPIVGVFGADAFADEFMRMYDEGVPSGYLTGWECLDRHWRVQPGQLTIVTGIPGHGKSEWVDALVCNLAQVHGWRTAFYSPENQPTKLHMAKLAEKYIGKPCNDGPNERMSRHELAESLDWMREHFRWIHPERPSLDEVLSKAQALVMRDGIRVLVIDPWNEVEHDRAPGVTEAEYVSVSLMRLRRFARKHDIVLIVVAHPRLLEKKADGSYPVPSPYDISGGANWRNKADNCIAIYADPTNGKGDVQVHVQKVKFKLFGQVGLVAMRWDRVTGRYFERAGW